MVYSSFGQVFLRSGPVNSQQTYSLGIKIQFIKSTLFAQHVFEKRQLVLQSTGGFKSILKVKITKLALIEKISNPVFLTPDWE